MWTEQDNYEWDQGNTKSFGFFDREGKARPSVEILKNIIRDHTKTEEKNSEPVQEFLV
jgi:beta-glucosidase/6-phospho-beta-glucosidase/beta-galactosidase